MPKKTSRKRQQIILAVGLPGSGKSTYFRELRVQPLSSDALRSWLLDDETDQSQQHQVFSALRALLEIRLRLGKKKSYVDATNLTCKDRRPYFRLAQQYDCALHAIYFDISLATCKQRNRRRKRRVPEEVMDRMAGTITPPSRAEGFLKITRVSEAKDPTGMAIRAVSKRRLQAMAGRAARRPTGCAK